MEIQEAYFLRQFPGQRKMRPRHRDAVEWSEWVRSSLIVLSGFAILLIGGMAFAYQAWTVRQKEWKQALVHVEQLRGEVERQQLLSTYSTNKALELAAAMQKVVLSGNASQQPFMAALIPEVMRIQVTHGIPASATMAMAIYESGYGKSELALTANNFFGIKAFESVWSGDKVYVQTKDSGKATMAYFRSYPSVAAAVQGYADFLSGDRYRAAQQHRNGPDFVAAVLRAGYCPDRDYFENVLRIMERHELESLDSVRVPTLTSADDPNTHHGVGVRLPN